MTDYICGYIELPDNFNISSLIEKLEMKYYSIGILNIREDELYNFPPKMLPDIKNNNFLFNITDGPDRTHTTFLIDYYDYFPDDKSWEFPCDKKERLGFLLNMFNELMYSTRTKRTVIALTDCGQVEIFKTINVADMYNEIQTDFERYNGASNTLYEIIS